MTQQQIEAKAMVLAGQAAEKGIKALLSKVSALIRKAKPTAMQLVQAFLLTVDYLAALSALFEQSKEMPVPKEDPKTKNSAATEKASVRV